MASITTLGSIVFWRDRPWVIFPADSPNVIRLRPSSGNEGEICGIYIDLNLEIIEPPPFLLTNFDNGLFFSKSQVLSNCI